MKDYYSILGVRAFARESEIKSAFRKLVVIYHPDKNPSTEAALLILEINEAYEILGDPVKKRIYDGLILGGQQAEPGAPQPRKHRDPAYHKRPPNPAFKSKKQQTLEMMMEYVHITLFISRVAFAICLFLALDFLLPSKIQEEKIIQISASQNRYSQSNRILFTDKGNEFELSGNSAKGFLPGVIMNVSYSRLINIPRRLENLKINKTLTVPATIYGNFIFIPLILLVTSSVGALYKKSVELAFNLGIINFIVTVIMLMFQLILSL